MFKTGNKIFMRVIMDDYQARFLITNIVCLFKVFLPMTETSDTKACSMATFDLHHHRRRQSLLLSPSIIVNIIITISSSSCSSCSSIIVAFVGLPLHIDWLSSPMLRNTMIKTFIYHFHKNSYRHEHHNVRWKAILAQTIRIIYICIYIYDNKQLLTQTGSRQSSIKETMPCKQFYRLVYIIYIFICAPPHLFTCHNYMSFHRP